MLCPEVWNFPPPKIITSAKKNQDLNTIKKWINMNYFYKSIIIACPDEFKVPEELEDAAINDSEFYKLTDCPLTAFLESTFIESFVKNGRPYCLTLQRDSYKDVCACLTPNGNLTIHMPDFIFQYLGLEGSKVKSNFFTITIDLNSGSLVQKARKVLDRLGKFDFYALWEPHDANICPSSFAKYFFDQNIRVSTVNQIVSRLAQNEAVIPSVVVEPSELVEWLGMIMLKGDLKPEHDYVSSYTIPDCDKPLDSTRIALTVIKGFFTEQTVNEICEKVSNFVVTRGLNNYWSSVSCQGCTNSLWKFSNGAPSIFQSHDTTTTIIFSDDSNMVYSAGLIKFS